MGSPNTKQQIPRQRKGAKSDVSHQRRFRSEDEAKKCYTSAKANLLQINRWKDLAGAISAEFVLCDPFGTSVERLPLQGDYIRIHLPTSLEGKFDWVRIEAIEEEKNHRFVNWICIRVRPTDPPRKREETEHFFSQEATSNFSVERRGLKVIAAVQGRNELPNKEAKGLLEKIRNHLIALAAMMGFNSPQWKALVKGILQKQL